MQNQIQSDPLMVNIQEIRILKAIERFFSHEDIESVVKHLGSIMTDAISTKDANGDYWHQIPEIVEKTQKTVQLINFLTELSVLENGLLYNKRNIKLI